MYIPVQFRDTPDVSTPILAAALAHMQTQYATAVADVTGEAPEGMNTLAKIAVAVGAADADYVAVLEAALQ